MADADAAWMRRAIALAARQAGRGSPNPTVGCVLVRGGRVVGRGVTRPVGGAHAEIVALAQAGGRARGATAYVTLEPCNHTGRTGPCTEALIAAGVARVVCGLADPNRVARGGAARLRRAGVAVTMGVGADACAVLHEAWLRWVATGRPFVTLKAAITLDGRLAARGGDSRWVSGDASRKHAHRLRAAADAILVGARTVAADDPALTTRLVRGRDPQRVILDGKLSVPAAARALPGAWVVAARGARARPELARRGAEVIRLPGRGGRVELHAVLAALGKRGVTSLLVEGGGQVHGQLLAAGLVDKVMLFVAPKIIGAGGVPLVAVDGPARMAEAWRLERVSTRNLGDDILVSGYVAAARRKAKPVVGSR